MVRSMGERVKVISSFYQTFIPSHKHFAVNYETVVIGNISKLSINRSAVLSAKGKKHVIKARSASLANMKKIYPFIIVVEMIAG